MSQKRVLEFLYNDQTYRATIEDDSLFIDDSEGEALLSLCALDTRAIDAGMAKAFLVAFFAGRRAGRKEEFRRLMGCANTSTRPHAGRE